MERGNRVVSMAATMVSSVHPCRGTCSNAAWYKRSSTDDDDDDAEAVADDDKHLAYSLVHCRMVALETQKEKKETAKERIKMRGMQASCVKKRPTKSKGSLKRITHMIVVVVGYKQKEATQMPQRNVFVVERDKRQSKREIDCHCGFLFHTMPKPNVPSQQRHCLDPSKVVGGRTLVRVFELSLARSRSLDVDHNNNNNK